MQGPAQGGVQPNAAYFLLWDRIYSTSCRMTGSLSAKFGVPRKEVEDLQHEVFLRIYLALQRFDATRGEAAITTWMYLHAKYEVIEHNRRKRRKPNLFQFKTGEDGVPDPTSVDGIGPLDDLLWQELVAAKNDCVRDLKEPTRTRYRTRFPESGSARSCAEAAGIVRLSEDTMRESLRLAVKLILLCMGKKGLLAETDPSGMDDGAEP